MGSSLEGCPSLPTIHPGTNGIRISARARRILNASVGNEMMRKLIEIVVFGAKPFLATMATTAGLVLVATFLVAQLELTLILWVALFAASLLSVLGAGAQLHMVRKKKAEGFALPGEIPPESKRELMPYITIIIGLVVAMALMGTFPMIK